MKKYSLKEIRVLMKNPISTQCKTIHTSWQTYLRENFPNLVKDELVSRIDCEVVENSSEWWSRYEDEIYNLPIIQYVPLWYIYKCNPIFVFEYLRYNIWSLEKIEEYNKKTLALLTPSKLERLKSIDLDSINSLDYGKHISFISNLLKKQTTRITMIKHINNGTLLPYFEGIAEFISDKCSSIPSTISDPLNLAGILTSIMQLVTEPEIFQLYISKSLTEMGLINVDDRYF